MRKASSAILDFDAQLYVPITLVFDKVCAVAVPSIAMIVRVIYAAQIEESADIENVMPQIELKLSHQRRRAGRTAIFWPFNPADRTHTPHTHIIDNPRSNRPAFQSAGHGWQQVSLLVGGIVAS